MNQILAALFFPLYLFAAVLNLPQPYKEFIEKLAVDGKKLEAGFKSGSFYASVEVRGNGGYLITEIVESDFLSFYKEPIELLQNRKPQKVSIRVISDNKTVPFNPFYQLWDRDFGIDLLNFSKLKPACKGEILEIKAENVVGVRILLPFEEVKKFFQNGFRYPTYYCP